MKREVSFNINNHKWTIKQKSKVEIKSYELNEIVQKDEKDMLIDVLMQQKLI